MKKKHSNNQTQVPDQDIAKEYNDLLDLARKDADEEFETMRRSIYAKRSRLVNYARFHEKSVTSWAVRIGVWGVIIGFVLVFISGMLRNADEHFLQVLFKLYGIISIVILSVSAIVIVSTKVIYETSFKHKNLAFYCQIVAKSILKRAQNKGISEESLRFGIKCAQHFRMYELKLLAAPGTAMAALIALTNFLYGSDKVLANVVVTVFPFFSEKYFVLLLIVFTVALTSWLKRYANHLTVYSNVLIFLDTASHDQEG